MKILAIEKEIKHVDWEHENLILIEEVKSVYKLMLSDNLREIYFTEQKNAVLILECEDKMVAKQMLDNLPLVIKGLVEFDIMELQPYTGFSRLMNLE